MERQHQPWEPWDDDDDPVVYHGGKENEQTKAGRGAKSQDVSGLQRRECRTRGPYEKLPLNTLAGVNGQLNGWLTSG